MLRLANLFKRLDLKLGDAKDRERLEKLVDLIIDGGVCANGPSTVIDLTGDAPALELMQAQTEVSRLVRRHADVAASVERLEEMARDTHTGQGRILTAGALAAERLIGAEISLETLRQRDQLDSLATAMQDARAVLAKQDYRQTWMEDAAKTARRDERSAREALVAAATPPRRRA